MRAAAEGGARDRMRRAGETGACTREAAVARGIASRVGALALASLALTFAPFASTTALANDDRPGTAIAPAGVPTPAELEAKGATIGAIEVHVQNIFDTTDPRESARFYRLANALHYKTREHTVREQLLFASGETFSAQRAAETERILRRRQYLNDAWVVPVRYDAETNVVDVSVTIRDVWTLNPGFSFGRTGGANRSRYEIEEQNLFGQGIKVSLGRSKDVDRTSTIFEYADPNLFGRWWELGALYSDNSDGKVKALSLQRPFYALDTRSAWGVSGYDGRSIRPRYDRGLIVDQFEEDRQNFQVYGGRSEGLRDGWTRRWYYGWRYDHSDFSRRPGLLQPRVLPEDRRFSYPWVGWQLVEDRFAKTENVDLIGRTEDLYLGRSVYAELGYADRAFGSDESAVLARVEAAAGFEPADRTQVFVNGAASGRLQDGQARNVLVSARGRYFFRLTDRQLLYAALQGSTAHALDGDRQLLLGGEEGLRGYPLRFQGGTSSALLTLEHRIFTDWYPFRVVRFGTAVFFDVGRTWGRSFAGTEPYGTLKDVGFGLRLGNVRSGLGNVLHIDFSYALDARPGVKRFEVTIETRERF
jgi:outer membrane protein assembly factor BamA